MHRRVLGREGLLIFAVTAAMLPACGGTAGSLPTDDLTYGFQASIEVATAQPVPGRRVDLIVAVTSIGNVPVDCDVTLRVVSPTTGDEIYAQRWESVRFMPS